MTIVQPSLPLIVDPSHVVVGSRWLVDGREFAVTAIDRRVNWYGGFGVASGTRILAFGIFGRLAKALPVHAFTANPSDTSQLTERVSASPKPGSGVVSGTTDDETTA